MNKALFLDRDGVINVNHGYVHRVDDVVFIDGIFDLVKRANQADYVVVIVTNQSGIARGMYSEQTFLSLQAWMAEEFAKHDAKIDALMYCPHHPSQGSSELTQRCQCRKPETGMFIQAQQQLDIDFSRSLMVGDKSIDMLAAINAGIAHAYWLDHRASVAALSNQNAHNTQVNIIAHLQEVRL